MKGADDKRWTETIGSEVHTQSARVHAICVRNKLQKWARGRLGSKTKIQKHAQSVTGKFEATVVHPGTHSFWIALRYVCWMAVSRLSNFAFWVCLGAAEQRTQRLLYESPACVRFVVCCGLPAIAVVVGRPWACSQ